MFYVRQPSKLYPENPGPCKMGVSPALGPEQVHFSACVWNRGWESRGAGPGLQAGLPTLPEQGCCGRYVALAGLPLLLLLKSNLAINWVSGQSSSMTLPLGGDLMWGQWEVKTKTKIISILLFSQKENESGKHSLYESFESHVFQAELELKLGCQASESWGLWFALVQKPLGFMPGGILGPLQNGDGPSGGSTVNRSRGLAWC